MVEAAHSLDGTTGPEGDGEIRSTFGTTDAPQCYTDALWREPELRS